MVNATIYIAYMDPMGIIPAPLTCSWMKVRNFVDLCRWILTVQKDKKNWKMPRMQRPLGLKQVSKLSIRIHSKLTAPICSSKRLNVQTISNLKAFF